MNEDYETVLDEIGAERVKQIVRWGTAYETILNEIGAERAKQIVRWGTADDDALNSPFHWVTWITRYATRWCCGSWDLDATARQNFRTSMIKVAALAVAAIESHDRKFGRPE